MTSPHREEFGYQTVNEFFSLLRYCRDCIDHEASVRQIERTAEQTTDPTARNYIENAAYMAHRAGLEKLAKVLMTCGIGPDDAESCLVPFDDVPKAARIMRTLERLTEDRTRRTPAR